MSTRLSWADNAKALGMFLVFFGHFIETAAFSGYLVIHEIYKCIYAFHMPFFFFLSGLLFYPKSHLRFGSLFIQKIKTRLVPVIFFVVLASFFWLYPYPSEWSTAYHTALERNQLLIQGKPTANWVCWFLICLLSVELIANELVLGLSKRWLWILLPFLYWFAYSITKNSAETARLMGFADGWWYWQEAMVALVFYLFGYLLAQQGQALLPATKRMLPNLILAASLVILIITYRLNFADSLGAVNMSGLSHGDWRWFLPAALAGSLVMIHVGGLLPIIKPMTLVGRNTLPLIGISGLFLHFFNAPLWSWLSHYTSNEMLLLSGSFIIALLSLLISLPLAMLFSRYLPWLVGQWK